MPMYFTKKDRDGTETFVQTNIENDESQGLMASEKRGVYVAVVGSKSFADYDKMKTVLDATLTKNAILISGGAAGADSLAEKYAIERGRDIKVIMPDWDNEGPSAGFKRNKDIVENASIVVAFHDGQSKGTRNTIDLAKQDGIPVHIVPFNAKEQTKAPAYYSDKPLTEKQKDILNKYGSDDAKKCVQTGDNRRARIHIEILVESWQKERDKTQLPKNEKTETNTPKTPSKDSGPDR